MTDLIKQPDVFTKVGLNVKAGLDFDAWLAIGEALKYCDGNLMWWWGDWLNYGEREYGEKYSQALDVSGYNYSTLNNARWVSKKVQFTRRRVSLSWSHHLEVAQFEPEEQDLWLDAAEKEGLTRSDLRRHIRESRKLSVALPTGQYRTIVIDPPWPMEKIVRKIHPEQGVHLDYPIMSLDEIAALPIGDLAFEDGCHLYLWVTQKFLPAGLDLVEQWGFKYQCLLTWVKPGGMTPFSWMYNTEHVIFARMGTLPLLKNGEKLSFEAPTQGHSVKPDIFFERVGIVSPEPRIELFARKEREGFNVWGNEV